MVTETCHLLPGHAGRCKNMHGHSYLWEVSLSSEELQTNGMVEDFSDLKKVMTEVLDPFDHAFVYHLGDRDSCLLADHMMKEFKIERFVPMMFPPTAENFAFYVWQKIRDHYPKMWVNVRCWETATSWAEYAGPKA
jgi:6-pyruvoyltetrahydropterin/6-carboxytetrahydropterin synthase